MTIDRARKMTLGFYLAAVALIIIGLFPLGTVVAKICRYGFFACVLIGFFICYTYCRCPHCGRVINAGFRRIEKCPFCEAQIRPDSRAK